LLAQFSLEVLRLMMRVTLTLTAFLLVAVPIGSAAQTKLAKLAPDWTGGYTFGGGWTLLRVHITDSGSELSATIDVPSADLVAQPITNLRQQSSTIAFQVPQGAAQLSFEGHIGEDAIEGTVVSEERQGRFQLLRLAAVDRASLAQYQGAYQWSANHLVYIQFWDELGKDQLGIFDESGETRTLYVMEDDKFFVGSGVAYPVPLEARIAFHRNAKGAVTSLSWQSLGKVARVAERVTPYSQQDITFRNGEVLLAGTLTLPNRVGKHPAMVLVHGSGPEDRNALLPFVRFVVRHGIALLAYDKRGVGGSTGDWRNSSFNDLAGDAIAAIEFLKLRNDIDPKQIGVFGVSQGGWIGPLVASRWKDTAFLISVSGAGVTPAEETLDYMQSELRANEVPANEVAEAVSLIKLAYNYARTGERWDEYLAARKNLENRSWLPYIGAPATQDDAQWAFMRLTYFYDPIPALKNVHCPTLAFFGGLDVNVLPEKNKAKWETALKESGNRDYTLLILAEGNHVLMEAKTGSTEEFPSLQRFLPEYFGTLLTWMSHRIRGFD
jgi:pimeloyl-ACP methyl ester carboxylesterase